MDKAVTPVADSLYRSLFTAYPDALLVVDNGGTIVLANPAASAVLGYEPDELRGLSVEMLVPDSIRPRHAQYRATYDRNPRPRPMGTQMELVARRKDGSEVMVEIALSPLQPQGLPYTVAAIRDIGLYPRVRQALKRARYAEQVAQVGRLAVDTREGQLLLHRVPQVAAEALEAEMAVVYLIQPNRLELLVAGGVGLIDAEPEGSRVPNSPSNPAGFVLAQGEPVTWDLSDDEKRFKVPSAYIDAGFVGAIGVPLSDRGVMIGALIVRSRQPQRVGDDEIHFLQALANMLAASLQRAETEEALNHAQRLESVGQLTGGIAHDFNNLLTVIQGNLQVLEELPAVDGDDYAQQLVGAATRASKRGAELTAKLLAFSRRQVLKPSRVDVMGMVRSLTDMLKRTLDQRIQISINEASACPPVVADPGQLESSLLNIAINARDAMPEGGKLVFSCTRCSELPREAQADMGPVTADDFVAIAITDTGGGMPESVKERVFEPFFTTKEAGRGTGLGLSTVYGFAKQSKGTVTIDSMVGVGTTVTLYIPAWHAQEKTEQTKPAAAGKLPKGLRVLMVEDEHEVRSVVRAFLLALGCEVTARSSGEHAIAALTPDAQFDLLITDIALGAGMRGPELAKRVHALRPGMAVLLMSGYASELRDAEADAPGARNFLRKPFSREDLAAAIVDVLPH